MRGARAVSIAIAGCAAVGCFSDRGVAIEIDVGDTGASTVELFIGKDNCRDSDAASVDCTGVAPPEGRVHLTGEVWFRDDPLPFTAPRTGRTATFQLRSDSAVTIPILVAVGLVDGPGGPHPVGSATLRDVAIPVHSARIDTATLVTANAVQPNQLDTGNLTDDRVQVWTKQTPPSSCVVVEHWQSGQVTRDFVVPADDPDCDDIDAKLECDATAWHAMTAAGLSQPDCFASGSGSACVLGSHACSDGAARTGSCAPQREQKPVCVPEKLCGCDIAGSCSQLAISEATNNTARIECLVPAHSVTTGIAQCTGNSTTIDLGPLVQTRCEQPQLGSLQLAGFNTSHSFGGATFELSGLAPACSFTLTWKADARTSTDPIDYGLIEVPFAETTLLVPIVFRFVGPCTSADQLSCAVVGNLSDPMWSCPH